MHGIKIESSMKFIFEWKMLCMGFICLEYMCYYEVLKKTGHHIDLNDMTSAQVIMNFKTLSIYKSYEKSKHELWIIIIELWIFLYQLRRSNIHI